MTTTVPEGEEIMRPRRLSRHDWPQNLREPKPGYYTFENPITGNTLVLGRIPLSDAKRQVREVNLLVAKKRDQGSLLNRLATQKPSTQTFGAWRDEYQTICERELKSAGKTMSLKTEENRRSLLNKALAAWKDIPLREITIQQVAELLNGLKDAQKFSSAQKMRSVLMHVFQTAEANGRIDRGHNPVSVTSSPGVQVKRARLTWEAFQAIYAAAAAFDPWVQNSMMLALVSSQRREDIGAATFRYSKGHSNMWLDGDWLMVEQGKGGNKLRIPLGLTLTCAALSLREVIGRCRDNVMSKHMIHHTRTYPNCPPGTPIRLDLISARFKDARDLTDLTWGEETPPTFHELRSLSQRLYQAQGNVDTQALLGHKNASMTAVYNDARGAEFKEVKVT
jgi:integrase